MADTRERILDTAQQLLQTSSYRGVSFQEIADRVGIRKASLYHHFRSKDELITEVLKRACTHVEQWHESLSLASPVESLRQFLQQLGNILGAGTMICTSGACVSAWDEISSEARKQALALWEMQESWLREVIEHGRAQGVFRTDAPINVQLELILSTVQGALLVARAREDSQLFTRTTEALIKQLQR